jgi:Kef-type K+ transport system membrane component KefB
LLGRALATVPQDGPVPPGHLALLLVGLFASAWFTQWAQVNFVFGAFLFGAAVPRSQALARRLTESLAPATQLLLPVFFVATGLTVNLDTLQAGDIATLAGIIAIAMIGKFGGGFAAARLSGVPARGSVVLASLVNTRGLTELVILSVGLQQHLLSTKLYSLMVVMALVTTAMAGPVLNLAYPRELVRRDLAEFEAEGEAARPRETAEGGSG